MTLREIIDAARYDARVRFNNGAALLRDMMGNDAPAELAEHPINIATKIIFGYGADTASGIDAQLGATDDPEHIIQIVEAALAAKTAPTVKSLVADSYISAFCFGIALHGCAAPDMVRELMHKIHASSWRQGKMR